VGISVVKERVADVSDFIDATSRVASGGTVLDPEVSLTCSTPAGAP
jgi:hypothetical protein